MLMALVCERMHWTYWQYAAQPVWFIDLLLTKFGVDGEHQMKIAKKQSKAHGNKSGNIRSRTVL